MIELMTTEEVEKWHQELEEWWKNLSWNQKEALRSMIKRFHETL